MAEEEPGVLTVQNLDDATCMQIAVTQLTMDSSQEDGQPIITNQVDDPPTVAVHDNTITDTEREEAIQPPTKRFRTDTGSSDINHDTSVKQLLFNINKAICMRLDGIENSIEILNGRTKFLEEKIEEILQHIKQTNSSGLNSTLVSPTNTKKSGAVIVGLPQNGRNDSAQSPGLNTVDGIQNMGLGPNVTLITLNSEEDYPTGTWLGDENNPEMRVRTPITPSDLLHVHSNCRTAEKMALTMLDYLFDRETQATSNLSGMGKHGKKQLDPLMIYGIRCHLIHRFGITEADWHRIKLNIDSKCRTAFRRKMRGMPLTVKAFRGKSTPSYIQIGEGSNDQLSDEDSMQENALHIHQGEVDIKGMVAAAGEGLPSGEIQILHATPEQISQLQQAQHIQILHGDQVIQVPMPISQADLQDGMQVAVSMPQQSDGLQVASVKMDTGEVVQIQHPDPTCSISD